MRQAYNEKKKQRKEQNSSVRKESEHREKKKTTNSWKYKKQISMKEKVWKEYFRTTRKLFETKLCSSNQIKWINA